MQTTAAQIACMNSESLMHGSYDDAGDVLVTKESPIEVSAARMKAKIGR
jgi:hypothetical protein